MERAGSLMRPSAFVVVACALALAPGRTAAKSVTVIPKTEHQALTMSTDGSYGFQVKPGRALKLDLVGPGVLTLTVRLNHSRKLKAFQGILEIRRNSRRIKRARLRLFRSRVGAYNEDRSLHPSTPKVFKVKVPTGLQSYTFGIRGRRGLSMTLGIDYDTRADQSAAQAPDDLALVPLVPPDGGESPPPDDLALVPLTPLVSAAEKKPPAEEKPPAGQTPPGTAVAKAEPEPSPAKPPVVAVEKTPEAPIEQPPPAAERPPEGPKLAEASAPGGTPGPQATAPSAGVPRKVETIEPRPPPAEQVEQAAPRGEHQPFLAIGAKVGEISPLQNIGSASLAASLDLRYVLPVFSGRISLGIEAGYHQFSAAVGYDNSTTKTNVDIVVVPISLQLFYRIPLGTFLEPFVGAGGDLLFGFGEVAYAGASNSATSGTGIGFGGHLSAGAEAHLGPGYLMIEVRAGLSKMDLGVVDNLNASGLAVVAGYRFEI